MELKTLPGKATVACPDCKSLMEVRTHALCRFVVCGKCRSAYARDNITNELSFKRKLQGMSHSRYLSLGDEGVFYGRRYVVVGWIGKKEQANVHRWSEYHLFNPVHGFAQLSVYEGHWTFHEQMRVYPRETNINDTLIFDRRAYEPYNRYQCTVLDAMGEFTHDIREQQKARVRELVNAPYMLTREVTDDEMAWYLGEYVEPTTVQKVFSKKEAPPARHGVGACQPMKLAIGKKPLAIISVAFAVVMAATMFVLSTVDHRQPIFRQQFDIPAQKMVSSGAVNAGEAGVIESGDFRIDRWRSAVELEVVADAVDNSWFELGGALINNSTGETRTFTLSVEYYHGYTDGESWSEGGRSASIVFSAVPAGEYHLEMYPMSDTSRRINSFLVMVDRNTPLWSNFFLMLLAGLIFPLFIWWRVQRFETARWGE